MTEKDWLGLLGDDPAEVLPYMGDWFSEQDDGAGAAFCEWFLRQDRLFSPWCNFPHVGPLYVRQEDHIDFWWWTQDLPTRNTLPPNYVPAPLFRHGLVGQGGTRVGLSLYYNRREEAWGAALSAWRDAWDAGELEEYCGGLRGLAK